MPNFKTRILTAKLQISQNEGCSTKLLPDPIKKGTNSTAISPPYYLSHSLI
jgi:hypothetical protein